MCSPSGTSRGPLRDKADFERMRAIIRDLRSDYDWIVIDTPPALRTTEVSQIAAATHAVLIVARYGLTSRRLARSLGRKVGGWRTKHVSTVLVALPRKEDPAELLRLRDRWLTRTRTFSGASMTVR